jgi:FAD:protein FMN transferase
MGTTVRTIVPEQRPDAAEVVESVVGDWERALSRFRPDSELSRLNACAGRAVSVSPMLFEVTKQALAAARSTGGIFDPSLLRQLLLTGYRTTFEEIPDTAPALTIAPPPGGGWRRVRLDVGARTIRLPIDVELDFGGIAKGMAVDAALLALRDFGVPTALVSAGGDLAVLGTPRNAEGWAVELEAGDDWFPITLHRGAAATSSVTRRRWRQGDEERHHLLDPRTGLPSHSALRSVSAVAADCRQAEVAAKVALILGPEAGRRFIEQRGMSALFVDQHGETELVGPWSDAARGHRS